MYWLMAKNRSTVTRCSTHFAASCMKASLAGVSMTFSLSVLISLLSSLCVRAPQPIPLMFELNTNMRPPTNGCYSN